MLLVSDCCGAVVKEGYPCPVCGGECLYIEEQIPEDEEPEVDVFDIYKVEWNNGYGYPRDEEPEEDNWKGELIEDRGIDADNFLFH